MTTIEYKVKNVYGNELKYPVTFVPQLEALTGKKTISNVDIHALEGMGFEFKQVI